MKKDVTTGRIMNIFSKNSRKFISVIHFHFKPKNKFQRFNALVN